MLFRQAIPSCYCNRAKVSIENVRLRMPQFLTSGCGYKPMFHIVIGGNSLSGQDSEPELDKARAVALGLV